MSRILYTTHYGSKLFGTSTPNSDTDVKNIELPDIQGLLVGHAIVNRVKKTNDKLNAKNSKDDVDTEFIPLQVFARDFMAGQTYALEIAFSTEGTHAGQTHFADDGSALEPHDASLFKDFLLELKGRFLTREIGKMLGMAVNQATIYSLKGDRLLAANEALSLFESKPPGLRVVDAMADPEFAARAAELARKHPKYFQSKMHDNGGGRMSECFVVLHEKTIPWGNKIGDAAQVVSAKIKKFGERAQAASSSAEGGPCVDWKATMHALRVVDEGIELMREGRISLPATPSRAAKLLQIRRGELPLQTVHKEIEEKIEKFKLLSDASPLPARSPEMQERFDLWLQGWMMRFYGLSFEPGPKPARAPRSAP